jgi:hypothetical protein
MCSYDADDLADPDGGNGTIVRKKGQKKKMNAKK